MARTRTTKKLAQRIDLNYFKRPTPYKRVKLFLTVFVPLLALGWIVWRGFSRDSRVYSSGRMSGAHAILERQCAVCHLQKAGEFSSKAVDNACLACHDGPVHHDSQTEGRRSFMRYMSRRASWAHQHPRGEQPKLRRVPRKPESHQWHSSVRRPRSQF